ncbi:MAG: hypothetical protein A4E53_00258 [Pelotomaculum sp. PtaB.Bin104]|nr:MAG: hypothetical protein A4E53_00258 [Pelotomaculum sp. PtaB.Bin104]
MTFTDVVKTILVSAARPVSPQEIREAIKKDYPQFFGIPSHARAVEKKQCINLDHALLSQIYSLVRTNRFFFCDKTTKPMEISIAGNIAAPEDKDSSGIWLPEKPINKARPILEKENSKPKRPTPDLISDYLCRWEKLETYTLQEASLNILFKELCPENNKIEHILLKVCALNDFYSTNIFDTFTVAKHILNHNIDIHLHNNCHALVNTIASVSIKGKLKNFYSFASKYCSHHKPDIFPIYDSYVEKMLWHYRKHDKFHNFEKSDLKSYRHFIEIINKFQRHYRLEEFSLRQIDIFLWLAGKEFFPKKY